MMQNIVEYLREESISNLFKMSSFHSGWETRQNLIRQYTPVRSARQLLDLGDNLANIFKCTSPEGRSQSAVSAGGAAWEALVCWYLNLCLIGRRTVVIKQKRALIPDPIMDAIAVKYNNFSSTTESDLIAITFPNKPEYQIDKLSLNLNSDDGLSIDVIKRRKFNYKELINALVCSDFSSIEINIIQCKTNWNDNAQIPMLWNMIYLSNGFRDNNITIGQNGYSIDNIASFTYSFATVPTINSQSLSRLNPNSTQVRRVQYLTGGNYWGSESKPGVASSIKEMLQRNLQNGHAQSHLETIKNSLPLLNSDFSYFRL